MSHYPHRIRLRGPWHCEPLGRFVRGADGRVELQQTDLPAARRMTMPCRWQDGGLTGFTGRVRFRRHFGYPGQIDDYERVWLMFEGFEGIADITLNDRPLGRFSSTHLLDFDVTKHLSTNNDLEMIIESQKETGGLWGDVALEIRRTAFLRDIDVAFRVDEDGTHLHVCGDVVGSSETDLELYVLMDNKTISYTRVAASESGQVFQITESLAADQSKPAEHEVRVELVSGASVWYIVERQVISERLG